MKVYVLRTDQWGSHDFPEERIVGVYKSKKLAAEAGRKIVSDLLGANYTTITMNGETTHSKCDMHIMVAIDEFELDGA